MWPDRVSNPGPLTYESSALLTALRGPVTKQRSRHQFKATTCIQKKRVPKNGVSVFFHKTEVNVKTQCKDYHIYSAIRQGLPLLKDYK